MAYGVGGKKGEKMSQKSSQDKYGR